MIKIIDTTNDFINYYLENCCKKNGYIIWDEFYGKRYDKFYKKIIEDLKKQNINIKELFNLNELDLIKNLKNFYEISKNFINSTKIVENKIKKFIDFDKDIKIFIYLGFNIYAGWATFFDMNFVIIFDLLKIKELKWTTLNKTLGLLSHEISHIIHMNLRGDIENFEENEESHFLLYTEGFAQWFGEKLVNENIWYPFNEGDLNWCQKNVDFLKKEFLYRIEKNLKTYDFFGDWFDIKGVRMTGYFLGYNFIKFLEKFLDFNSIVKLKDEEIKYYLVIFLKEAEDVR
ncbi:MAG: hypothetical protein QMD25_02495 [Caldisericia bacterium]|nr:hypothetical protein [Caldisericia bacterium]